MIFFLRGGFYFSPNLDLRTLRVLTVLFFPYYLSKGEKFCNYFKFSQENRIAFIWEHRSKRLNWELTGLE